MEDVRFGSTIRAARIRRGWRQRDLAEKSDVSRATISRIEGGHIGSLPLDLTRSVCKALEISLDVVPRWRGGELDRMLSVRHSQLHESVARMLTSDFPDWALAPEVSFAHFGERGVIDLLLWHPARRALLVIELKTDLVDVNELLGTMDRKRRLVWDVAKRRGWVPATVSAWIVVAGSRTNDRRVAAHRTMLRAGYPAGGRGMRAWLADPVGSIAALSMWPTSAAGGADLAAKRRVRRPKTVEPAA
ncbi:MAG: helix-turn-helix domain-containing protein [Candidatus Limnocylindrales bacterium]